MANTSSAKKAAVQNEARRQRNTSRRTAIKSAIKKVLVALEEGADQERIQSLFRQATAQLGRAKTKGVLHRNTASRKIGRLADKVNSAQRAR